MNPVAWGVKIGRLPGLLRTMLRRARLSDAPMTCASASATHTPTPASIAWRRVGRAPKIQASSSIAGNA